MFFVLQSPMDLFPCLFQNAVLGLYRWILFSTNELLTFFVGLTCQSFVVKSLLKSISAYFSTAVYLPVNNMKMVILQTALARAIDIIIKKVMQVKWDSWQTKMQVEFLLLRARLTCRHRVTATGWARGRSTMWSAAMELPLNRRGSKSTTFLLLPMHSFLSASYMQLITCLATALSRQWEWTNGTLLATLA